MRLVSFELDGQQGFGAVDGARIARLDGAASGAHDLKSFLAQGGRFPATSLPAQGPALTDVRLLPPIPNPGKVICVATNFHEPSRAGKPDPEFPIVFTRFADSFVGHGDILRKPDLTPQYDFEGELAVIIGKNGFEIPRDRAMEHVAGYSCLNDGSVRDWQKHSSQFTPGKNFYRSGSWGPWLVTTDEIADPAALTLETRVNGVVMQGIAIEKMIFDVSWLVSYFSTFTPLNVGDVIATGTPSGFGSNRTPPQFLSPGDTVEVEISGIGILSNVVASAADSTRTFLSGLACHARPQS